VSLNYIHHAPFIYMSAAIRDHGLSNIIDRNWYEEYSDDDDNDDGFWDTPYSIPGSASNTDLHPLVYPPHPPEWTEEPTMQIIDYWGQSFSYDLDATAPSPITWLVNDTVQFTIDNNGVLQTNFDLPVGSYGLRVKVTNLYGLYIFGSFQLIVQEISLPEWIAGPTNIILDFGEDLDIGLIVTDESGISEISISDDVNFSLTITHLNVTGYNFGWDLLSITNSTTLLAGVYPLNVTAIDPYGNTLSSHFIVIIVAEISDTIPPVWISTPSEQTLDYGSPLTLQLAAWDASGIEYGWVNDTIHFAIDENWIIRNASTLEPGVYGLEVRMYDTFDNYCSANLTVIILDASSTMTTTTSTTTAIHTTTPDTPTSPMDGFLPIMTFALGVGLGAGFVIVLVILIFRKSIKINK
jgi:hypothetical protein